MKKLMIMAFVAIATIAANATTVKWGTGTLYTAKDETGAFSTTKIGSAASIAFYVLTDGQYTAYANDSEALFAAANEGLFGASVKEAKTSSMGSNYTWSDTVEIGITKNIAMIVTYTDADLGDFYIAKVATATPASATQISVGNIASDAGAWSSVPEPTSGLLLVLGMAGLALRRRRA